MMEESNNTKIMMEESNNTKMMMYEEPTEASCSSSDELTPSDAKRHSSLSEIVAEKGFFCVQVIFLVKLIFDLVQAVIGFQKLFIDGNRCCGYELDPFQLRPLSLGQMVAGPFVFLILLELLVLIRSVFSGKKNKPSALDSDDEESQQKPKPSCCTRLLSISGKALMGLLNKVLLINPFFGCFIAWMLLYQSSRSECVFVLGLELGSILLHFIAVGLTETIRSRRDFLFTCIPLIPFIVTVALVLVYMKQQGVCYIVEQALFHVQGCELCPDGYPPIDGKCTDQNGTSLDFSTHNIFDVAAWDSVTDKSSDQGTFCGSLMDKQDNHFEDGQWENTHFCFFPYQ